MHSVKHLYHGLHMSFGFCCLNTLSYPSVLVQCNNWFRRKWHDTHIFDLNKIYLFVSVFNNECSLLSFLIRNYDPFPESYHWSHCEIRLHVIFTYIPITIGSYLKKSTNFMFQTTRSNFFPSLIRIDCYSRYLITFYTFW